MPEKSMYKSKECVTQIQIKKAIQAKCYNVCRYDWSQCQHVGY